jgi:hypothetical protein
LELPVLELPVLELPVLELRALEVSSLELPDVTLVVAALAVFTVLAAFACGRVAAMATAPRTPAAPTPRVTADIRASPCLRASFRAEPEVGEVFMACSDSGLGCARQFAARGPCLHDAARACAIFGCFL